MEISYNKIYYKGFRPSEKSLLVAIPMYVNHVQTVSFNSGLDFLERLVLRFKRRPGMTSDKIALYIGLPEKLINTVSLRLVKNNYLTEHGGITPIGQKALRNAEGTIVDNSAQKLIGHVFQYVDKDQFYPFYVTDAELAEYDSSTSKIIFQRKDESLLYVEPIFLNVKEADALEPTPPSDITIARLISNATSKYGESEESEDQISEIAGQLSIKLVPTPAPSFAWICTYIYLPELEDGVYSTQWKVKNPFGQGDSDELETYIRAKYMKQLGRKIQDAFADAETLGNIRRQEAAQMYQDLKDEMIDTLFGESYSLLETNIKVNTAHVIDSVIHMRGPETYDYASSVIIGMQKTIEDILINDRNRKEYEFLTEDIDSIDREERRRKVPKIFDQNFNKWTNYRRIDQTYYTKLRNASHSAQNPVSMLSYLAAFIMVWGKDRYHELYDIFYDRIEFIIELAQLRNREGHGGTFQGMSMEDKMAEAEKCLVTYVKVINEYIEYIKDQNNG